MIHYSSSVVIRNRNWIDSEMKGSHYVLKSCGMTCSRLDTSYVLSHLSSTFIELYTLNYKFFVAELHLGTPNYMYIIKYYLNT